MLRLLARRPALFACLLLVLLSGCASESISGDTATYTYSWFVGLLAAAGSIALGILGVKVIVEEHQLAKQVFGLGLVGLAALFLLGFTPRVFYCYVTVDANHVEGDDRAVWFLEDPKKKFNIALSDVVALEDRVKQERGRKGRMKDVDYLVFRYSNGGESELLVTSLLAAARPRIEEGIRNRKNNPVTASPPRPAAETIASLPPATTPDPTPSPIPSPTSSPNALPPGFTPFPPPSTNTQPPSSTPPTTSSPRDSKTRPAPQAPSSRSSRRGMNEPTTPAADAITSETKLTVGQRLEAFWGSRWWPVDIVELRADGQVKIHYDGWSTTSDEVVPRDRLRRPAGTTTASPAAATPSTSASRPAPRPAGRQTTGNVTAATSLQKGQRLEALWGTQWWTANIVELQSDGKVKVHYEGWSDTFDETVPRDRLLLPTGTK